MRKIAAFFILLLGYGVISSAQVRVAIVAGGHQSRVIEENNLPNWNDIKDHYKGRIGFHTGFVADIPFSPKSKLFFQPGVLFYNKGRKYAQVFDPPVGTIVSQKSTQYVNYVDIPLNLVLKFGKKTKFIIGGGPYGSFFYSGKETSQTEQENGVVLTEENNDLSVGNQAGQYRTYNYGVNGLVGVEFRGFFITANYSHGLNDFYQSASYDGSFRHQVIGGTLGVFLGKGEKIEKKVKDKDKDGIPDDKDNCPDEAGTAATNGCPDKDADGIADKTDKCPDVAGLAKYEGCPVPDTDKDGINDEADKCPDRFGVIRYAGCPVPDTDNDGVNDEEDKCPSVKGTKERNGCPPEEIKKEIVEKVNYAAKRIQFKSAQAVLLPQSLAVLDEVAKLLADNPDLHLAIEGHTSGDGIFEANMQLSKERAENVKAYLVKKGIDAARLDAKGFGPTQPLNNGKTPADKAQNRRVELKLSN
ncbi:MAG: OmpA family protein [Sphingobacteriales bacterium]|nr:OmpA family protein [Sphingobacteriales bacterium]